MLNKIKELLNLNPKASITSNDEPLDVQVGIQGNRIVIKLGRKVDVISFDRAQLTNLLAALASRAQMIK